jgi:hypothetical protein
LFLWDAIASVKLIDAVLNLCIEGVLVFQKPPALLFLRFNQSEVVPSHS